MEAAKWVSHALNPAQVGTICQPELSHGGAALGAIRSRADWTNIYIREYWRLLNELFETLSETMRGSTMERKSGIKLKMSVYRILSYFCCIHSQISVRTSSKVDMTSFFALLVNLLFFCFCFWFFLLFLTSHKLPRSLTPGVFVCESLSRLWRTQLLLDCRKPDISQQRFRGELRVDTWCRGFRLVHFK